MTKLNTNSALSSSLNATDWRAYYEMSKKSSGGGDEKIENKLEMSKLIFHKILTQKSRVS
jgi:hypothetical protein